MKFELKTENYSKSILDFLRTFFCLLLVIIICDVSLKLKIISRNYQIKYSCNVLSVDKSTSNFNKLSRLSKLKSKQQILDFCRKVVN